MARTKRVTISHEETRSLLKRCTQEKQNKEVAKIIGVAEARISEGKKGDWRLSQEQKDKLINEFGFEQLHKGRYLLIQKSKCFDSMLKHIKAYDLFLKTDEYFTFEPFRAFLTEIHIDELLEHVTAKDWFNYVSSHQENIMSYVPSRNEKVSLTLSEMLSNQPATLKEDLRVTHVPPTCINYSAKHDLDIPPKYIDDQQEHDENQRSMFNLCKDYFEGNNHEHDDQFWTRMYLLCHLKKQGLNIANALSKSHDERCEINKSEVVVCGRTVWKESGRFDLHGNQLLNSLLNEKWERQNLQDNRLKIERYSISIELLKTESNRYFLLCDIGLPGNSDNSIRNNLQHEFLTEELDKYKVIDKLIAICGLCGIKQDPSEIRSLLAEEGALISTAEYIY
jgi:hypothetical protein